jgi:hyperosmotically inducible periplasmic protein
MNKTHIIIGVSLSVLLGSAVALADEDASSAGSHVAAYVNDSAITTKIKTKLAAEHLLSLSRIHVDTDTNGIVWLSGTANTQEAADKARSIALDTEGVKHVHSDITVKSDQ